MLCKLWLENGVAALSCAARLPVPEREDRSRLQRLHICNEAVATIKLVEKHAETGKAGRE